MKTTPEVKYYYVPISKKGKEVMAKWFVEPPYGRLFREPHYRFLFPHCTCTPFGHVEQQLLQGVDYQVVSVVAKDIRKSYLWELESLRAAALK